jgi:hypothetical protein
METSDLNLPGCMTSELFSNREGFLGKLNALKR